MVNLAVKSRIEHFQDFGNHLPHAKVYYREDWETLYFDLAGKMFGVMSPNVADNATITLKGQPEANATLCEMYRDITAGYHMNKKHWISIKLSTDELSDREIEKMIENSYSLAFGNLPFSIRKFFVESE
ncbi:MmcQ/YjbR family DNA-binding protein [Oenococcus sicerae]|uniref:MmcQ/YjbR family DNA-binding protein n=1 Tax=Oenococcus sicerae TaxID=2203724 RepID=A0AAJ1VQ66_9LACO|nr:MmcQ/YjbR family DNA-binding protein [Oenococcus sicerae]MDN6899857.1 MmcQ/YjbR family DNA-binding protein [Oenococcus sicerae]